MYLSYPRVGRFLVREGKQIVVSPHPAVEVRVLRLFLLGVGLGVILHQRGRFVLHSSAVNVAGGAVAFLGWSGQGKSTMAAAMHKRGHSLVADDVVAVDAAGSAPKVYPGFPQLKLWPEAAVALGEALESLPHLRPGLEKRARRVTRGFTRAPLPLRRVYVLAEGGTAGIERLPPHDAMLELIRHSYCARLLQSIGAETHFQQCATVVNQVGVRRLRMRRDLKALGGLTQLVEDDLGNDP